MRSIAAFFGQSVGSVKVFFAMVCFFVFIFLFSGESTNVRCGGVSFVPGWDCHGMPIEHKVLKSITANKLDIITTAVLKNILSDF